MGQRVGWNVYDIVHSKLKPFNGQKLFCRHSCKKVKWFLLINVWMSSHLSWTVHTINWEIPKGIKIELDENAYGQVDLKMCFVSLN